MRLSTKTQYAVRALYDLAFHGRGEATQAKEIADREHIPPRYLEQILQDLRRGGIVAAKRGPRGGYALTRAPAAITMGEILRAVRGPLEDMFAMDGEPADPPAPTTRKPRRERPTTDGEDIPALVWRDLTARLFEVLDSVTLQDFVVRAEAVGVKRAVKQAQMYFI